MKKIMFVGGKELGREEGGGGEGKVFCNAHLAPQCMEVCVNYIIK